MAWNNYNSVALHDDLPFVIAAGSRQCWQFWGSTWNPKFDSKFSLPHPPQGNKDIHLHIKEPFMEQREENK